MTETKQTHDLFAQMRQFAPDVNLAASFDKLKEDMKKETYAATFVDSRAQVIATILIEDMSEAEARLVASSWANDRGINWRVVYVGQVKEVL